MRFTLAALALAASTVVAAPAPVDVDSIDYDFVDTDVDVDVVPAVSSAKVYDPTLKVNFAEWVSPQSISFRVALSDAATKAPFDLLLSIIAPKATGWAGVAWGGQMANNPLTIGWANGAKTVVSSRLATGHVLPGVYAGASYVTLPSSVSNSTHWRLDVLCSGCSTWTAGSVNPTAATATFAYGMSGSAPAEPANNASRFAAHSAKGRFTIDLASGRQAGFDGLVKSAIAGTSGAPADAGTPVPAAPPNPSAGSSNTSPSQASSGQPASPPSPQPVQPPPPLNTVTPAPPASPPPPKVPVASPAPATPPPSSPAKPPSGPSLPSSPVNGPAPDSPYNPSAPSSGDDDGWEWVYVDEDGNTYPAPPTPAIPLPPIAKGKKGIPPFLKKKKAFRKKGKFGPPFGKKGIPRSFIFDEDEDEYDEEEW